MKPLLYESELLDAICRQIAAAESFHIAMALVSKCGVDAILSVLESKLRSGGKGRFLAGVDMPTHPDAIECLHELSNRFPESLSLRVFKSSRRRVFHMKLSLFEDGHGKWTAILGSSNLTHGGLVENYEANLLVDDQKGVQQLRDYFDEHFQGGRARNVNANWLDSYRTAWIQRERYLAGLRAAREKVRRIKLRPSVARAVPKRIKEHAFCFTGRITDWPREAKLYPLVERFHGRIVKSAKGIVGADCLVHGDILGGRKTTVKLNAARLHDIPVIEEEEFFQIVKREEALRRRT